MCITYISLYPGCGCRSDSFLEPCEAQTKPGECSLPPQEVILDPATTTSKEDDKENDDDSDERICWECTVKLQTSVRELFKRCEQDGIKVRSRVGDQVFSDGGSDDW